MKTLKRTGIIFLSIVVVISITITVLFWNELRSLSSIKKLDDYGMFQMTYYGDYGFDDFLAVGAASDSDIEAFVTKRLLKGVPIDLGVTGAGCTVFVTQSEKGETLFSRNFDFSYAPSLQLFTAPANGYASVSTVNLTFAGYSEDNLPNGLSLDSFLTLAAPFLPFDGMNEKGVAIALLAVPEASLENDEEKITLNTTTAIRLVLDKAASVDEAVALLRQHNIYFSGGINCHFLIADASGKSVLVEYYDGQLQTITTEENYQIASNFIAYNGVNIGEGFDEFERYDKVKAAIEINGWLSEAQSLKLLAEVGVRDGNTDKLQWSVLYNLTTENGEIFAHRNADNTMNFQLDKSD
ncbi:MAG: linear amide C-N hydrolase [Christensenellaceae bacterium]|jgi:hypothetical protein|nr:linear amide C-N hydrolase [Christensenellaceae bacterium]